VEVVGLGYVGLSRSITSRLSEIGAPSMNSRSSCNTLVSVVGWILYGLLCSSCFAQDPIPAEPKPSAELLMLVRMPPQEAPSAHHFWDKKNCVLFAAAGVLISADFAVTRANLQNGGSELNPVARVFGRSTSGLAANSAGQIAGAIGISYLFHKTGHHRLERITSLVDIGASGAAVAYGLRHR